jgi:hypothetical protein
MKAKIVGLQNPDTVPIRDAAGDLPLGHSRRVDSWGRPPVPSRPGA